MAKNRKTIGIIGSDSSHVSEFIRILNQSETFHYKVNQVMLDTRSELKISRERQTDIIEKVKDLNVEIVKDFDSFNEADAYMILNLDARFHLDLYKKIRNRNKKIFIDKPITYDIKDLEAMIKLDQGRNQVFSSSAFIFSPFTQRIKKKINNFSQKLIIKGPLYKVENVPSFHWYGIHLLSILKAIRPEAISNLNLEAKENFYLIEGKVSTLDFEIHAYLKDFLDFEVYLINKDEIYFDSLKNDPKQLYEYLLEGIIDFFEHDINPFTVQDNYEMLSVLDKLNNLEKKVIVNV